MNLNPNYELNAITLNTVNRITNSDISSPIYFVDKTLYNVRGFKVKNITIPLTVYTIDSRNNKLYLQETAGITSIVTLTSQNYTASQIATELASKLSAASQGGKTYTVTYNSQTNKLTISASSGTFAFVDGDDNANYELGITSSDLGVFASSLTPSTPIDLSGVKCLSVVCPSFSSRYSIDNYNVIASATINERVGDIASYSDNSSDYITTQENSISSLAFFLVDERGRRLTLNKDWLLTLYVLTE